MCAAPLDCVQPPSKPLFGGVCTQPFGGFAEGLHTSPTQHPFVTVGHSPFVFLEPLIS